MSKNNKVLSEKQKAYNKFITSPEWQAIKDNLFALREKKCEVCGSTKYIQVHHLTYKRFGGKEKPEDLKILCGKHHKKVHGIKVTKKKRKNERGLPTYKQILINKYGVSKKGKGWLKLANNLICKLKKDKTFADGNEALAYVKEHVESLEIDINTVKVKFNKKKKLKGKPAKKKKEFVPKVILRKRT